MRILSAIAATALIAGAIAAGIFFLTAGPSIPIPRTDNFETTLTATGVFEGNIDNLEPADGYHLLELESVLFTDGAKKQRLLHLPEGATFELSGDGLPQFPEGTVMVKTFYFDNDETDPSQGRRILETRLETLVDGEWNVATYVWNDEQTDGVLTLDGETIDVTYTNAEGIPVSLDYEVPDEAQCVACHQRSQQVTPLGPELRNLNIEVERDGELVNQLVHYQSVGLVEPFDVSTVGTMPNFLDTSLTVERVSYVNQENTFEEFQEFYADQPEVLDLVEPEQLPTSFRVVPEIADLTLIRALGDEIQALPGVSGVDYAEEYIQQLNELTNRASFIMLIAAIGSAAASALLAYNTIRTGLFARRREIEVMRLVGATKWFIRVPFMMEGLLQGLIGALFATLAIFGLSRVISRSVEGENLRLFESFALDFSQLLGISATLFVVGALLGAAGAALAVTRYLDA